MSRLRRGHCAAPRSYRAPARSDREQDIIAHSANDLARLEAEAGNTSRAAEWYRHSMDNARASGNQALVATAAVNLACTAPVRPAAPAPDSSGCPDPAPA